MTWFKKKSSQPSPQEIEMRQLVEQEQEDAVQIALISLCIAMRTGNYEESCQLYWAYIRAKKIRAGEDPDARVSWGAQTVSWEEMQKYNLPRPDELADQIIRYDLEYKVNRAANDIFRKLIAISKDIFWLVAVGIFVARIIRNKLRLALTYHVTRDEVYAVLCDQLKQRCECPKDIDHFENCLKHNCDCPLVISHLPNKCPRERFICKCPTETHVETCIRHPHKKQRLERTVNYIYEDVAIQYHKLLRLRKISKKD